MFTGDHMRDPYGTGRGDILGAALVVTLYGCLVAMFVCLVGMIVSAIF